MTSLTPEDHNCADLATMLTGDTWIVACLCAAWCDLCRAYRVSFDDWAARHPDKHFVWIDIEDQADLVGDLDIDNFPTLLIQRGATVAFFGTVPPDRGLAERLLLAQVKKSDAELHEEATKNPEWQNCNLGARLRNIPRN